MMKIDKENKYILPCDNDVFSQNKTLIITGVGRSGTTILGKVIGSLKPVYYLFEPALMRMLPFLTIYDKSNQAIYSSLIRSILFEDYFLQLIHGRTLNFNVKDDSYIGNYMAQPDIENRWHTLSRRRDVIDYIKQECPVFAVKIPDLQPLCSAVHQIFSEPVVIHIIRNGNNVVSSMVKRGWYSDEYMNHAVVDWTRQRETSQKCNIPWYIDEHSRKMFPHWNQITRAACVWRSLTETGMTFTSENPHTCFEFKYEDFIAHPESYVRQFKDMFGLQETEMTFQHLKSIQNHKISHYPSVAEHIQEPERDKFNAMMKQTGYMM